METVLGYRVALLVIIAVAGGSSAGSAYYYQSQNSDLNNKVSDLKSQVSTSSNQVSSLNNQVSQLQSQNSQLLSQSNAMLSELSQLQSQNSQLQSQVALLQAQVTKLNHTAPQTNSTLVSTGTIGILQYGPFQYIPFTSTPSQTKLNITFSGGLTIAMLLNQTQHDSLLNCNCYNYDNYTSSTWQSPQSTSYQAIISIPIPGNWYVAFSQPASNPNRGYFVDSETISLISPNVS